MSENAQHSGTQQKAKLGLKEFVALMACLTSLVALSIDSMLPALALIGQDLGAENPQDTHLIVSVFFLGMAIGQLYYGPVSDAKGRRAAILSGLLIFALGTVVCMMAENMAVMLFGRLVQAFGVSGPRIASLALIRDQYAGEAMARVMSFMMMVFILVPMIAPVFGQAILMLASWQYIFASFLIIGSAVGIWFFLRQPETLPAHRRRPFRWQTFRQTSMAIVTHKQVMAYTLAMGLIFGAFLAYLSASQTVFEGFYKVGDLFPLYFAILASSVGVASFVNGTLVMRMGMNKLVSIALVGLVLSASILSALAFSYDGLPPLLYFVPAMYATFFFIGILFGNLNALAMQPLGQVAGLGAAIIGSLSSLFSVPIAIVISHFLQSGTTPLAMSFALLGIASAYCVYVGRKSNSDEVQGKL